MFVHIESLSHCTSDISSKPMENPRLPSRARPHRKMNRNKLSGLYILHARTATGTWRFTFTQTFLDLKKRVKRRKARVAAPNEGVQALRVLFVFNPSRLLVPYRHAPPLVELQSYSPTSIYKKQSTLSRPPIQFDIDYWVPLHKQLKRTRLAEWWENVCKFRTYAKMQSKFLLRLPLIYVGMKSSNYKSPSHKTEQLHIPKALCNLEFRMDGIPIRLQFIERLDQLWNVQ